VILHVDMDAFYASVEERENPHLQGKPLIVGGSRNGRGVVAAANYAARKYGIHSAMPAAQAFRLYADLVSVRPRIDFYAKISRQIREIFFQFTPLVEPLSLDEAFLDVTGCEALHGSGVEIAYKVKALILKETQLIASVGVAPNKYLAKIASDLDKPDGLVVVDPDSIEKFLDPLPVGRIWGVGKVTGKTLQDLRINTIRDLRELSLEQLRERFGSQGEHFYNLARGIDHRKVVPDREAKSISHERTFETDLFEVDALRAWAQELTEQVARRLRRHKILARTLHLKIRFSNFKTLTRSYSFDEGTNVTAKLWHLASEMLSANISTNHPGIRLLGVGVSHFSEERKVQKSLFAEPQQQKQKRLDQVADRIQEQFGMNSIIKGTGILHQVPRSKMKADEETPD
jgi:DNA polymerase IV